MPGETLRPPSRSRMGCIVGLLLLLCAIPFAGHKLWLWSTTRVTVANHSGRRVDGVAIVVNGGTHRRAYPIGSVANGKQVTRIVRLDGEGSASVRFTGSDGKPRVDGGDYLEGQGGYHILLSLEPNDRVKTETRFME